MVHALAQTALIYALGYRSGAHVFIFSLDKLDFDAIDTVVCTKSNKLIDMIVGCGDKCIDI